MKELDCVSFCRALGDETRQEILRLLQTRGELTVNAIVTAFGRSSQPTISHHLKILNQEGLVLRRRMGKQVYYALDQSNVEECCGLLWARFAAASAQAPPAARVRSHRVQTSKK